MVSLALNTYQQVGSAVGANIGAVSLDVGMASQEQQLSFDMQALLSFDKFLVMPNIASAVRAEIAAGAASSVQSEPRFAQSIVSEFLAQQALAQDLHQPSAAFSFAAAEARLRELQAVNQWLVMLGMEMGESPALRASSETTPYEQAVSAFINSDTTRSTTLVA